MSNMKIVNYMLKSLHWHLRCSDFIQVKRVYLSCIAKVIVSENNSIVLIEL